MNYISIFDIIKIGVGPSSSHTMGPWMAANAFLKSLKEQDLFGEVEFVFVHLFGSLAKTGKGHATDVAVQLGLMGFLPEAIDTEQINQYLQTILEKKQLVLNQEKSIDFVPLTHIVFHKKVTLDFHPNGLKFEAVLKSQEIVTETYFSTGGGFIVQEGEENEQEDEVAIPFSIENAMDLLKHTMEQSLSISQLVWQNELVLKREYEIEQKLLQIWQEMQDCVYRGCHASGELPGGLRVIRRAGKLNKALLQEATYDSLEEWLAIIGSKKWTFNETSKWISCFALAVNEENAALGRVVTAPTNGASGIIPAVLLYYFCFERDASLEQVKQFLLVSGIIGSLFKKGATISAAAGGCQAEVGVSSAMAAAALTECRGGTVAHALMAAEIAMEHHLGLTCDPIGGLVQIPCIERNTMGAIKAITASNVALESDPAFAKVSLDSVIRTMWETAQDMNTKYKETSEGGLATQVSVNLPEC